jgi:hypothetical protein
MNKEDIRKQFLDRYDAIINGGDTSQMERLGKMVKRVMEWLIKYEPSVALQAVEMLSEDDCNNYLSKQEASAITQQMSPAPAWSLERLQEMLASAGLPLEDLPYYNSWALLTTMSMILSDDVDTLARLLGSPGHPASNEQVFAAVYHLAIDRLKDADGKFNIRKYFDL